MARRPAPHPKAASQKSVGGFLRQRRGCDGFPAVRPPTNRSLARTLRRARPKPPRRRDSAGEDFHGHAHRFAAVAHLDDDAGDPRNAGVAGLHREAALGASAGELNGAVRQLHRLIGRIGAHGKIGCFGFFVAEVQQSSGPKPRRSARSARAAQGGCIVHRADIETDRPYRRVEIDTAIGHPAIVADLKAEARVALPFALAAGEAELAWVSSAMPTNSPTAIPPVEPGASRARQARNPDREQGVRRAVVGIAETEIGGGEGGGHLRAS